MLGSRVLREFTAGEVPTIALSRTSGFDVSKTESARKNLDGLNLSETDLLVNCVGWIPQKSSGDYNFDTLASIHANSILPNMLEDASRRTGASVIQILTDCVFSGDKGSYSEQDVPDADDLYGLTKRLGEHSLELTMGIRCSIVGFASPSGSSLFDWFLKQPSGSKVKGYVNHLWNGVSTKAFAQMTLGVFRSGQFISGKHHWIPFDFQSKYQMLKQLRDSSKRTDLELSPHEDSKNVNRTLISVSPEISQKLWQLAGYAEVPTIFDLISELVAEEDLTQAKGTNGSQN